MHIGTLKKLIMLVLCIFFLTTISCQENEGKTLEIKIAKETLKVYEMTYKKTDGRRSSITSLNFAEASVWQQQSVMRKKTDNTTTLNQDKFELLIKLHDLIATTNVYRFKDSYEPEIRAKDMTFHRVSFHTKNENQSMKNISITKAELPTELSALIKSFWEVVKE
jgi:predicted transcriptional regulator